MAKLYTELEKRNVKLLDLSMDSVHSHIAWVLKIKDKMDIDIPFPVIADITMSGNYR